MVGRPYIGYPFIALLRWVGTVSSSPDVGRIYVLVGALFRLGLVIVAFAPQTPGLARCGVGRRWTDKVKEVIKLP